MDFSFVLYELDGVAVGIADEDAALKAERGVGQLDRARGRRGGTGRAGSAAAAAPASATRTVVCQWTRSFGRSSAG